MQKTRLSKVLPHNKSLGNPYLQALRPHQWTKNLIIFAAPLFAFAITPQAIYGSIFAFLLFCALSSSFYLINDIVDVEADRLHPVKCHRPIAAGLVPIPSAITMAIALQGGALMLGFGQSLQLGSTLLLYTALQIAYNLKLKRTVILDVIAIACGFVLRAYGGAAATAIVLSPWFILCTAMLALFLGIEKRKAELRLLELKGGKTRAVLQRYSHQLLSRMEGVVVPGTITSYALWSAGPDLHGASTPWMMLTLPFVLYGIFRYQLLSDPKEILDRQQRTGETDDQTERPDKILLTDKPIILTVLGWVLTVFTILCLKNQALIV